MACTLLVTGFITKVNMMVPSLEKQKYPVGEKNKNWSGFERWKAVSHRRGKKNYNGKNIVSNV